MWSCGYLCLQICLCHVPSLSDAYAYAYAYACYSAILSAALLAYGEIYAFRP